MATGKGAKKTLVVDFIGRNGGIRTHFTGYANLSFSQLAKACRVFRPSAKSTIQSDISRLFDRIKRTLFAAKNTTMQVNAAEIWPENGGLKLRGPDDVLDPLLPELQKSKVQILDFLKLKAEREKANFKALVYRVVVDGKGMTVIDPHRLPFEVFERQIQERFGVIRVDLIEARGKAS